MALAACKECGNQVSDSAISCPQCGVADPVETDTWVTVLRKSKVAGALLTYYLTIDGITETIAGGETMKSRIKPGRHTIEFQTTAAGAKRQQEEFSVEFGQTVEYEIGFNAWSGAKLIRVR